MRTLGIDVLTNQQVSQVTPSGIHTRQGRFIPAVLEVWCAGIKAPAAAHHLDGLEIDRMGRVVVDEHLQAKGDPAIYGLGDCAAAIAVGGDKPVPPRAQAAYQQALILARTLERRLRGQPPLPFVYNDYGSLISLSYSAVGSLMGNLFGTVNIEGGWRGRPTFRSTASISWRSMGCAGCCSPCSPASSPAARGRGSNCIERRPPCPLSPRPGATPASLSSRASTRSSTRSGSMRR